MYRSCPAGSVQCCSCCSVFIDITHVLKHAPRLWLLDVELSTAKPETMPVKALFAGDVGGKVEALFKRVGTVNASNGPFDLLLCTGGFFSPAGECREGCSAQGTLPNRVSSVLSSEDGTMAAVRPSHCCHRLLPPAAPARPAAAAPSTCWTVAAMCRWS